MATGLLKKFQFQRRLPGRPAFAQTFLAWVVTSSFVHFLLIALYGLRCYRKEHVTSDGPAIYVSNHQSHLDPPILGVLVADRPFSSLARASLFRNRFFAGLIRWLGAVPLEQGKGDIGAIKTALAELEAGRRVLIFPEGSRTPDGTLQEFQRGVMLLIKRAKVPVIPLVVEGAYDVWPAHQALPRLGGRLAVMAGEPIDPEQLLADGANAGLEQLRRTIESMRMQLRHEMRNYTGGRCPQPGPGDVPYWEREGQAVREEQCRLREAVAS